MLHLKTFFYRLFFVGFCLIVSMLIGFLLFKPIYITHSLIIPYSLHPYDICTTYPLVWKKIKLYFILFYFLSNLLCSNALYSILFKNILKNI